MTRMTFGVSLWAMIFLISLFFTHIFITDAEVAIIISATFACITYFPFIFPHVTFIVPENKAWIMSNRFVAESAEPTSTFSGSRTIEAQKEFQAGFHWKYPWDVLAEGGEIDMKKVIPVEDTEGATYTLRTGKTMTLKYQVLIVPLPGYVVNFFRTREKDIVRRVKARAEAFLQGYIGSLDIVSFGEEQIKNIQEAFEKEWGGKDFLDPEEIELGIWTGTPEVYDISNPKDVEDARNFEKQMDSVIAVANKMVRKSKNQMPHAQAMKLALVGRGQAKIDFLELSGALPIASGQRGKKKGGKDDNE